MLATAIPKPEPRRKVKARRQRSQATADRAVYRAARERDKGICQHCFIYCGASIHQHHIVFRSRGGATTLDNLIGLCARCHRAVHEREGVAA